jgi:hypothetical protein
MCSYGVYNVCVQIDLKMHVREWKQLKCMGSNASKNVCARGLSRYLLGTLSFRIHLILYAPTIIKINY